jgi:uncharacterized protein YqeY
MTIEQLRNDMITAMKNKDKTTKDGVSSLIDAIKKVAIDEGHRNDIGEDLINKVVLKEIKSVEEQIASCPADRTDLIEEYSARLNVIKKYAPKLLSEDEIKAIIQKECASVLADKNKGQIMKILMPLVKGKADGKLVNSIVEELCK